jgi:HK97 gp10 family phage protein
MEVMGLNGLIADLVKAGLTIKPRAQAKALESAERTAETMRSLVPVLTGTLRDSIEVEAVPDGAEVGPTVDYAPPVEYGAAHMAPQPFVWPAVDQNEAGFIEGLAEEAADI